MLSFYIGLTLHISDNSDKKSFHIQANSNRVVSWYKYAFWASVFLSSFLSALKKSCGYDKAETLHRPFNCRIHFILFLVSTQRVVLAIMSFVGFRWVSIATRDGAYSILLGTGRTGWPFVLLHLSRWVCLCSCLQWKKEEKLVMMISAVIGAIGETDDWWWHANVTGC